MAVTAVRGGITTHQAGHLPDGEPLLHALLELPVGAHAQVCLALFFVRELLVGHLQLLCENVINIIRFGEGCVLISVK